ncbi:conserved hypothetical protein [Formosa agariphila KMM 3901]|uniref:Uncharacterized protein n=1 Tax=Formosa agariphila (strain DSM 15362 / KCTC 12365 / LMG 23005 / KMM 3901 / M-2Alg 35-1) TaxID=1347342 RepID=T2KJL8_FORAG|nr:DUF6048 family protein [Formosa agariphila]CDF78965.1 conserved hypothetical protein [Formosa agariphila KMM 3901]
MKNNLNYTIKTLIAILCFSGSILAQSELGKLATKDSIVAAQAQDSTQIKEKYGLRVGVDLSKLVRTAFEEDYEGFEVVGDYRLTKFIYLAGEFGAENNTEFNDFYNATTKGSYFKVGVDYNAYRNWLDMENMIYGGFRIGASAFSQTLNSYSIYTKNQYWAPQFSSSDIKDYNGLTALWAELIIGFKVEILNNLYLGAHVEIKGLITQSEPDNFENLYIPGFNKTYDSLGIGTGYGYSISYLIPLYKKDK